jgi:hypothetical protein
MDINTAKKTIVQYLTGSYVNRKTLEEACEILNIQDPETVEKFHKEIGLHPDITSDCEAFQSMVDEFCCMTHEERQKEMPEMITHFENCEYCRELFWEVKTIWSLSSPEIKCLSESINAVISTSGIEIVGVSPPESRKYAKAMDEEGIPVREWVFEDDNFTIRVSLTGGESMQAIINLGVISRDGPPAEKEKWSVSVLRKDTRALHTRMKFARDTDVEIPVDPGSWILVVNRSDDSGMQSWEIPLNVRHNL